MATSLLAPYGVLVFGARPTKSPHRAETLKSQKLRGRLLRMAGAPVALALLTGGAILSQNAHPPAPVAAPNPIFAASAPLTRAPLTSPSREAVRMQELRQVESERESECGCVSCGSSSCWSWRQYIIHMTAEAAPAHNISYIWQMKQQLLELVLPWKNMEGSLVNANQVML